MSYTVADTTFQDFCGIREHNGINSNGSISALECKNVEFYRYGLGANKGIRSSLGNALHIEIGSGYNVIEKWESLQNNVKYLIVYAETETAGELFYINSVGVSVQLIGSLEVTGEANGITVKSNELDIYDHFIFTNGETFVSVTFDVGGNPSAVAFNPTDLGGNPIKGLSIGTYNGSLVVAARGLGLRASAVGDIYTFDKDDVDGTGAMLLTDSWGIDFSKELTAVIPAFDGLICATESDNTFIKGTPLELSSYEKISGGLGGCASYSSWLKHDIYLFFYDKHQRNIYYYQENDFGQKRLSEPVATEIQSYFNAAFTRCKMYSVIAEGRNEIWLIFNNKLLVFDYYNKEWSERTEPTIINGIGLYDDKLISCDNTGNLYLEHINRDFNGTFVGSSYETQLINYGSNSDLKKQKSPICITLDNSYNNNFWVQLTIDNVTKTAKYISFDAGTDGIWGDDTEDLEDNCTWDLMNWADESLYQRRVVSVTVNPTWYNLRIKIFTQNPAEDFAIQSIELKRIKMKNKTLGR